MTTLVLMGIQSGRGLLARIRGEQAGVTMIEYGVLAAFMVLIVAAAVIFVGPNIREWFTNAICGIIGGCTHGVRPNN